MPWFPWGPPSSRRPPRYVERLAFVEIALPSCSFVVNSAHPLLPVRSVLWVTASRTAPGPQRPAAQRGLRAVGRTAAGAGAGTAMDKAPKQFRGRFQPTVVGGRAERSPPAPPCPQDTAGLIGIWTRPGERGKSPRTWRRGPRGPLTPETQTQENEPEVSMAPRSLSPGSRAYLGESGWPGLFNGLPLGEGQGGTAVQGGIPFRPRAVRAEGEGRPGDGIGAEPSCPRVPVPKWDMDLPGWALRACWVTHAMGRGHHAPTHLPPGPC